MPEDIDNKDAEGAAEPVSDETPAGAQSGNGNAQPDREEKVPAAPAPESDRGQGDNLGNPLDAPETDAAPVRVGRRSARVAPVGIAHIKATFNNTIVSISDVRGNVVSWSSAGKAGFKGSRKSTAFAATVVGQDAARQAAAKGMHEVEVQIQGSGSGRESAVRAIQSSGLSISAIKDITPIPHNGCRQRKRRRV